MELTPNESASLADDVYDVQDRERLKLFLMRPEFSQKTQGQALLSGEIGARLINTKDAFGVCAVGGSDRKNQIFLIFRGSTTANYMADWVSNARIGLERGHTGSLVHIGFNHIFSSLLPELKAFLDRHANISGTIHCIGHSLGGAIANLAADWVKSYRKNHIKLYTFGSPRVGLEGFARQVTREVSNTNLYRVCHKPDPVAMIPIFPYQHAPAPGEGYVIPYGNQNLSLAAHKIRHYVDSTRHCHWLALKGRPDPLLGDKALEHWLASDVPDNAADPRSWERLNAALGWLMRKVAVPLLAPLQLGFIGAFTLADRIALVLRRGMELSKDVGYWTFRLMRRIMSLLGMTVARTVADLTRSLMRWVLSRLIDRMVRVAQQAVRSFSGR